jgi:alpha-beta hydrolase superfamily lysophospholipase
MRLRIAVTVFLLVAAVAQTSSGEKEWLGSTRQRVRAAIFRSADEKAYSVLVVVLHGDLDAAYHYAVAANAAKQIRGIVVAALVRPGYTDDAGDTSDGRKGDTTGDNYTPEVLNQLDAAIHQLSAELHPSAVVLMGHSGGAAISADLLAWDKGLAKAALLLSCPCDVPAWRKHMKTLHPFPQWDLPITSVSPMDVVDKISPKVRISLIVGEKDTTAPPEFTQEYASALRKHGIEPKVIVLPGRDHNLVVFDGDVTKELSTLVEELH